MPNNSPISGLTELAEIPALADLFVLVDVSDTSEAPTGTTKKGTGQYVLGLQVNAQTGTSYTIQTTDFRKLVTHTNAAATADTLPQAGASFPAGWYCLVQNRGAGAVTITPTTSTIDGAASLVLNQNEGALIVSDGTNYFTFRGSGVIPTINAFDFKASVRVATTANITLSGTQTIDGVSVIAGDRVLVKNQSTASQNGIYFCASGAWSRAADADTSAEVTAGMLVPVAEGTANADTLWLLTTNDPITLGSTSLTFTQFAAATPPSGSAGGDLSGTYPNPTVAKLNGTSLAGLATGLLKNTTGTGVPSIAAAGTDYVAPGGALGTPSSGNLSNCTADGTNGVGYKNIPQNSQSAAYTTVLGDAGKHIYHPTTDDNARTFTIDSNANVAYPIGTVITFVNDKNTLTIAITSDTLVWAKDGTTGSRTLAANGVATAIKVTSTRWIISGEGLS